MPCQHRAVNGVCFGPHRAPSNYHTLAASTSRTLTLDLAVAAREIWNVRVISDRMAPYQTQQMGGLGHGRMPGRCTAFERRHMYIAIYWQGGACDVPARLAR